MKEISAEEGRKKWIQVIGFRPKKEPLCSTALEISMLKWINTVQNT